MKRFIVLIACVAAIAVSHAQPGSSAYEAELDKVVALSADKQVFVETFENIFKNLVANGTLTEARCKAMSQEMAELAYPKICAITKDLWRLTFTIDELKQIAEWMSSPVGKKMQNTVTRIGEVQQQIFQDPEFMQQLMTIVKKYSGASPAATKTEQI